MWRRFLVLLWVVAWLLVLPASAWAQSSNPLVLVLNADGPITAAMQTYLERGIRIAEQQGAELLIVQLNTPGGDINAMTQITTDFRGSSVPVVVYVAPNGAMAASAGTIVTLAGDAAAMAPQTVIGAASPVGAQGQDLTQTEQLKVKETMKALARSLSQQRSQTAIDLANATIDQAKSVTASEAKSAGLIDFIAADIPDLLRQLNGYTLRTSNGAHTLNTVNANVVEVPPSLIEQLLLMLTDPNIVFLLLTIGVQAILIELSSPGGWVAGFVGVVCLALGIYGLGLLPVNYFGLVFLVLAFVLFVLDIKAPTHGALTAAGVASFILGALVLFNSPGVPSFQRVSVPLVVATGLAIAAVFFTIIRFALRAQRAPVRSGREGLTGQVGITRTVLNPDGTIQLGSELWTAELVERNDPLPIGSRVEVVAVDGVRLKVRRADQDRPFTE
jgi:membrane-bound serine protease (ClpP class)